jgi:hypothetical protein
MHARCRPYKGESLISLLPRCKVNSTADRSHLLSQDFVVYPSGTGRRWKVAKLFPEVAEGNLFEVDHRLRVVILQADITRRRP